MNLDLNRPQIFSRISNVYTFTNNPLEAKAQTLNFYIPWCNSFDPELMFKIKDVLVNEGLALIPLMDKELTEWNISEDQLFQLQRQIREGEETQLVMSNLDSIHVFNISGIITTREFEDYGPDDFAIGQKEDFKTWLKVNDVYVLKANHVGNHFDVEKELLEFMKEPQTQKIFSTKPSATSELIGSARWIEQNRSLTYDYFIRSCELKENVYQSAWSFLLRRTQHELIMSELLRHQGILVRGEEKWQMLKSSFEAYKSAVLLELAAIYLAPLVETIKDFNCLQASWLELQDGLIHPKLKMFLQKCTRRDLVVFDSIEEVEFYFKNAKSLFFSLEKRLNKRDFNENYLLVERFLDRQNSLVDSFLFRKLKMDIQCLGDIENWISNQENFIQDVTILNQMNLKLSHLLSKLLSSSCTDNLLFKLLEEKASHFSVKTSLRDEVRNLEYFKVKKTA